ncbi:hypothetical protein M9Y10_010778 [Tritrichomonas musculus]|uniref:Uncharacterized protein n=1 Tax=Tritrichomonas musculus TaxID=1915356 RepID=A0ABR2ILQ9_9EUKA
MSRNVTVNPMQLAKLEEMLAKEKVTLSQYEQHLSLLEKDYDKLSKKTNLHPIEKAQLTYLPQRIETANKDVLTSLKQCAILHLLILNMKGPEYGTINLPPDTESDLRKILNQ